MLGRSNRGFRRTEMSGGVERDRDVMSNDYKDVRGRCTGDRKRVRLNGRCGSKKGYGRCRQQGA